jgi:hypothetical protein
MIGDDDVRAITGEFQRDVAAEAAAAAGDQGDLVRVVHIGGRGLKCELLRVGGGVDADLEILIWWQVAQGKSNTDWL